MNGNQELEQTGLVLDDFLFEMDRTQRDFHLPEPKFSLKQIEKRPEAKEALDKITSCVIRKYGAQTYSRHHALLSATTPSVYSTKIDSKCPRWRIRSKYIPSVVWVLLERALQILVELPTKNPRAADSTRQLRTLASHLAKVADEARLTLRSGTVQNRIWAYYRGSGEAGKERLVQIAAEMETLSNTLIKICTTTALIRVDSPNPQVRFVLLIVHWLESAAGRPLYQPLAVLISAALEISERERPPWVDRIAIEMHGKRRRRKLWHQ